METAGEKVVMTFSSHFDAQMMRRRLGGKLIPVPRSLSSSCGSALELDAAGFDPAKVTGPFEGWYVFDGKEYKDGKAYQHG